jgi:cathepsin E
LTAGTFSDGSKTVPTVTDNLFSQGKISENLLGVSFRSRGGTLTFGGVDSEHIVGEITFAPITATR